jgi:8-oxo-dGTP diphosphatase
MGVKKQYVIGFLFHPDRGTVALINKNKPEWQAGKLNGIGGKLEERETPYLAMVREFEEEAGVEILDWKRFARMQGEEWEVTCFLAFDARVRDIKSMTDEHVMVISVKLLHLFPHISNLDWLIPLALDQGSSPGEQWGPAMTEVFY